MARSRREFLKHAVAGAGAATIAGLPLPPDADAQSRTPLYSAYFSSTLSSKWHKFKGTKFDPAHVHVSSGQLRLVVAKSNDGRWRGGGVSLQLPRTYGEYQVRMRLSAATGTRGVALLWPSDGTWPPEIDFHEIGASSPHRTVSRQTLHYGSNQMIHTKYKGRFTQWHTVGVKWRPGHLAYTCDGVERKHVTSSHVPSRNMNLHLQVATGDGPKQWTVMEVDWVKVFA
jgi:beta-glucanase (GH16 family)